MTRGLNAAVGQSLIAIGLYTVAFESMVLSFRAAALRFLSVNLPELLVEFRKSCGTADKTFKFCGPRLVEWGALNREDVAKLKDMRDRRNYYAHEAYNEVMSLTVKNIEDDVEFMLAMARKTDRFAATIRDPEPTAIEKGVTVTFSLAPAAFGLYLSVAQEIALTSLALNVEDDNA